MTTWFWFQGLEDEYQEEGQLLGQFTYDQEGESLQMFHVPVRFLLSEVAGGGGRTQPTSALPGVQRGPPPLRKVNLSFLALPG